jgi:hypothetical protein
VLTRGKALRDLETGNVVKFVDDGWITFLTFRLLGQYESGRTPCTPWMSTPSMSAVADGPGWKKA